MRPVLRFIPSLVVLLVAVAPLVAQDEEKERERPDSGRKKESIQPYDKVVTADAKSDPGFFLVHRVGDKILYEIPEGGFGKDLLWVTQIEKTQAGFGYGSTGVGNRVVRWELKDENVLLRDVKYRIRADVSDAVKNAVEGTSLEAIIKTFPVKAWGKDKAAVIDVTDLFKTDLPEFSAKRTLNSSGVDASRSFIESVRSFPTNIEAKVLLTYRLSEGGGASERGGPTPTPAPERRRGAGRPDPSLGGVTVLLHHSMVELPAKPMTARRHDERVGFFTVGFEDYGTGEHEVKNVRYINRWRLEKKDPKAEVSEPLKPIIFHVGRGVPDKWRPWVKKGIEAWQPAFEAAGFRNGIIAKDAPTEAEDPDWDAEDARYSTISWLPSTIENAMGPHVNDPRSGEILEADIIIYHNVLKLCRDWYFVQASPMDERAQTLPLPDNLLGELLAYVVAHEVGHSLGFPHNMKASAAYTVEQLRDPVFTAKNGTEASIMDYGRFNYVAQPGDGARLIPVIGPYDFFSINWGYRDFGSKSPEADKPHLDGLIAKQTTDPMLRFGDPNPGEDPSQQTEDLGSDAVLATELGLKNISRVANFLVKACCKENESYDLLRNMYDELVGQRNRELGHVANVVGGSVKNNVFYGQGDRRFDPMSAAKQREAVDFLRRHSFQVPGELIAPDILLRLEPNGAADRILAGQKQILNSLLSEQRVKRMAEQNVMFPGDTYTPLALLDDIKDGIWSELKQEHPAVDLYRRNLQRAHVDILAKELEKKDVSSDLPGLARGQLAAIEAATKAATSKVRDAATRFHFGDIAARIATLLNPSREAKTDGTAPPTPNQ